MGTVDFQTGFAASGEISLEARFVVVESLSSVFRARNTGVCARQYNEEHVIGKHFHPV